MDDRKKAAREARKAANSEGKKSAPAYGGRDWRIVGGGVKMDVDQPRNPEEEEQERLKIEAIDKMYQEALERKLQKVQAHSQKEITEFESAMRLVKKQIELQRQREARMRRRLRVKSERAGVLICGDLIEKITVSAEEEQPVTDSWGDRMESIVTVRIESGQSVQVVQQGSSDPPRVERGPQVLILASSERLVGATFLLNSRNASFKPEFNWHISTQQSPSLSQPSSYSYSYSFDSYADPTSSSHSFSFDSTSPAPSHSFSFSFDSPSTSSVSYDIPGTFDTTPKYSFSFETSSSNDSSQNGNLYSIDDGSSRPQFGFVVEDDEEDGQTKQRSPEERMERILEFQAAFEKAVFVRDQGYIREAEYNKRYEDIVESLAEFDPDLDLNLLTEEIEKLQKEIDERKAAQRGSAQRIDAAHADADSNGSANGGAEARANRGPRVGRNGLLLTQQQQYSPNGVIRGRGGAQRGGRGGERGGRPVGVGGEQREQKLPSGRFATGPSERRGRGSRQVGGVGGGERPGRFNGPSVDRGRGGMRGMREGGRGGERGGMRGGRGGMRGGVGMAWRPGRVAKNSWDDDGASDMSMGDFGDTESVASEASMTDSIAEIVKVSRISGIKDNIRKCQILLNYLKRFLSEKEIKTHPKLQDYLLGKFQSSEKYKKKESEGGENGENGENNGENGYENGIEHNGEDEDHGKGKGKEKEIKDEDLDYLDASLLLTDDEEGYYYEKEIEDARGRKKKLFQPKSQKTLFIPVDKFYLFAALSLFPPTKLHNLHGSIASLCDKCDELNKQLQDILNDKQRRAEARERRKQKEQEEREKAEAAPWALQKEEEKKEKKGKKEKKEKAEGEEGEDESTDEDEDEDEDGSHDSEIDSEEHSDEEDALGEDEAAGDEDGMGEGLFDEDAGGDDDASGGAGYQGASTYEPDEESLAEVEEIAYSLFD